MIRFFKEIYLTLFTLGFRFRVPQRYGGDWGSIVNAGKGVVFVCLIEFFILKGIESCIEIHLRKQFPFFDSAQWKSAVVIMLIFYLPNYYVLVTRGHGVKFEREFTYLKKSKKLLLLVNCAVLTLATIVFCSYSDFAYRHFFHL